MAMFNSYVSHYQRVSGSIRPGDRGRPQKNVGYPRLELWLLSSY